LSSKHILNQEIKGVYAFLGFTSVFVLIYHLNSNLHNMQSFILIKSSISTKTLVVSVYISLVPFRGKQKHNEAKMDL